MTEMQKMYYDKRAEILVKNLKNRHFDAYYCATKEEALEKALSLIRGEHHRLGWQCQLPADRPHGCGPCR